MITSKFVGGKTRSFRYVIAMGVVILLASALLSASRKYEVTGVLLRIDRQHQSISVSCAEIPGYMAAMVMDFPVHEAKELDILEPGATIDFSLIVEKDSSFANDIRQHPFESLELDPTQAHRYKLIEKATKTSSADDVLRNGQPVPDFSLTDQNRRTVSLAQFRGQVVAITFIYTRCPRPDYCVRLSNNFGLLQRRFKTSLGRDLTLLTIVIDPANDQPDALKKYGETWKADARTWHFLTGPLSDIQQVCRKFDMDFYPDEALLVHSFHTVIIDRKGRLAANLEGNNFTAQQLGDLVQTVMNTKEPSSE